MIDVSDGFKSDLLKMTKASNLGFRVNIDELPIRREMIDCIGLDESISMALSGGDDYELCFTISERTMDKFEKEWQERFETKLSKVGRIIKSSNEYKYNDQDYMVKTNNFEHF